jgi:membrane associated rhomboid family serine protease
MLSITISILLLKNVKENRKIFISKNLLKVPKKYFSSKDKTILIDTIESIQELPGNIGLIIGIKSKFPIYLEKNIFENSNDYNEFKMLLIDRINDLNKNPLLQTVSQLASRQGSGFDKYTGGISVFLVVFYLLLILSNDDYLYKSIIAGGNVKGLFESRELYRIYSSTILHGNVLHLVINLFGLAVIGRALEKLIGGIRFLNIYLISGFIGVLVSNILSPFELSIGASGCIYGLMGAYLYIRFKFPDYLPPGIKMAPDWYLLYLIVLEIILSIYINKIDYYAHFGGVLSGFCYAWLMPKGLHFNMINQSTKVERLLLVLFLALYIINLIYFIKIILTS